MNSCLVVAAHPDDEVIGCGGTLARMADQGIIVQVAFIADGVSSSKMTERDRETELEGRRRAGRAAASALGVPEPRFLDYPDNQLDTVSMLDLARSVESLVQEFGPDTMITHHGGDLNIDHRCVHQAVLTACRPQSGHPVRRIWCFEAASSTEWQSPGIAMAFTPQLFIDIGATLQNKIRALEAYDSEMRAWPHSRSVQGVEYLARWRGASVGYEAAEAFMVARELIG
ncbi:MAG: PIG-L family deacetylase [Wenzhouxiangella sp.]|nr:PIG-L family deacetylase [Wenzhouxiangella sp.]